MHTLLLRLVGPLQSWGLQSHFTVRDTGTEPSKSGVIGLLCAALGRRRYAPINDLASLSMGVRVDFEGTLSKDYHTAMDILTPGNGMKSTEPTTRYYLADARFLVGFEGETLGLLQELHRALADPVWPLYLGRKAFVPGEPVWLRDGVKEGVDLYSALKTYPWLGHDPRAWERLDRVRFVLEDDAGSEVRPDQPRSFAERRFVPRRVSTTFEDKPPFKEVIPCTSPD